MRNLTSNNVYGLRGSKFFHGKADHSAQCSEEKYFTDVGFIPGSRRVPEPDPHLRGNCTS